VRGVRVVLGSVRGNKGVVLLYDNYDLWLCFYQVGARRRVFADFFVLLLAI